MIFDYLALNMANVYIVSILLQTLNLETKKIYYLLVIDILINRIPVITVFIVLLAKLKEIIFKRVSENNFTLLIYLVICYFIFGVFIYGIYNGLDKYIFKYLLNNLFINLIIYYVGINFSYRKYN